MVKLHESQIVAGSDVQSTQFSTAQQNPLPSPKYPLSQVSQSFVGSVSHSSQLGTEHTVQVDEPSPAYPTEHVSQVVAGSDVQSAQFSTAQQNPF